MKKLLVMLMTVISVSSAVAQNRNVEALKKKMDKSDLAIADAKKNTKFTTWGDRALLMIDFANVYSKDLIAGASVDMMLPAYGEPQEAVKEDVGGILFTKYVYPEIDVYVDDANIVQFWKAKSEALADATGGDVNNFGLALGQAYEALAKGKSISQIEMLTRGREIALRLQNQYQVDGSNAYSLNDKATAARMFEGSLKVSELLDEIDTLTIYNTGMAYYYGGMYDKALPYFEKAQNLGYDKQGSLYYYLSSTLDNLGRKADGLAVIEKGFSMYPNSSVVMSGIINSYMSNNKDPELLMEIIYKAQELDPQNVSLFVTEGAIWDRLNRTDKAEQAFMKALQISPDNSVIYYNIGLIRTKNRDRIIEKADRLDMHDVKGYDELMAQSVAASVGAIEVLQKAHELNPQDANALMLLRELCYALRDKDAKWETLYQQYDAAHKALTAQ